MRISTTISAVLFGVLTACGGDDASPVQDTSDTSSEVFFPDGTFSELPDDTALEVDATPDTLDTSETAIDTTPETIADTTPETIADTTPETVADTTPETIADTTPETIADTAPETVADTAPETAADTVISDTNLAETKAETIEDTIDDSAPPSDVADTADTEPQGYEAAICTTDVSTAGNLCSNAYVIGRPNAQTGFGHAGTTLGAGNNSDFPHPMCGDSGSDRFYHIYLEVGEQLWVNANPSPASYDLTFGLYRGLGCETPITCVDRDNMGTTPDTMPYQAVEAGWHTLVIDGRNDGNYTVVVTLDCHEADCGCH